MTTSRPGGYEGRKETEMTIDRETFEIWKDQPILQDEDEWGGKYATYGEMWIGEGYLIVEMEGAK